MAEGAEAGDVLVLDRDALAASAVADLPGDRVAGLLHGELLVQAPIVGVHGE
ncbi:hypothetical protein [Nonomuraea sp. NPDC049400]|uniref:hypothetical protein n=1 Tax=Nonomuraea sp. NPDC049400 TaxID=3364352 RepID=UPI0037906F13